MSNKSVFLSGAVCIVCKKKNDSCDPLIRCCQCTYSKRHAGCAEQRIKEGETVCDICKTVVSFKADYYKKSIFFKKFIFINKSSQVIYNPWFVLVPVTLLFIVAAYLFYVFCRDTLVDIKDANLIFILRYFIIYFGLLPFCRFLLFTAVLSSALYLLYGLKKNLDLYKRATPLSIKSIHVHDDDVDIYVPRKYYMSNRSIMASCKRLFCLRPYSEYALMKMAERDVENKRRGKTFVREEEPVPMNLSSNNSSDSANTSSSIVPFVSPSPSTSRIEGIELARADTSSLSIVVGGIANSTPLAEKPMKTVRFDLSAIEEEKFPVMNLDVSKLSEDHPPSSPLESEANKSCDFMPNMFHSPQPQTAPADDIFVV